MPHKFTWALFLVPCILAGCKKTCFTNYRVINSYLFVYPDKKVFNIGDTICFSITSSFETTDERNGQNVNIKNTKKIKEFDLNIGKVDSITRPPGGYDNGLNFMDIIPIISRSYRIENINGEKGNIKVSFSRQTEKFEVKLLAVLRKKGVFMLEHGPTSGEDRSNCVLIDFAVVLHKLCQF
jgi:hypothetical protein